MKLRVGDIIKLNETIHSTFAPDDWSIGLYAVTSILGRVGTIPSKKPKDKDKDLVYRFRKMKHDGTFTKAGTKGMAVPIIDCMITAGIISIID